MKIFKKFALSLALITAAGTALMAKDYKLQSPDGHILAVLNTDGDMNLSISCDGIRVLDPSPISIERTDGIVWGKDAKVLKETRTSVNSTVKTVFYRAAEIADSYNALTLKMKGSWSLELRAYNDGVAYRFVNSDRNPFRILDEKAVFNFTKDAAAIVPYERDGGDFNDQYHNSFENTYTEAKLSELDPERLAFLPLVVEAEKDVNICFTEVNLRDYPGMYLINMDGGNNLMADFAPYPRKTYQGGHNNLQILITEREEYIAKVSGPRTFPWRAMVIGNDVDLASSNMTYLLADESRLADTSWIKPGKVAWEWWNDWNISGVDFDSGINNDTYKYYIDFAAEYGIEYVILDEGWAVNLKANLFQVVPEIDLEMLVEYADSKGVGLILWAGYWAFDRDMEKVCKHYSEMGIKGFKVDFMDRDDQLMTDFNYRAAEMAAKYQLILDLHGTHKPAGITRTWPNVLNVEGVYGLEQLKFADSEVDQMKNDLTIPFLRQVAGPMDYTQGAMDNKNSHNYEPKSSEPVSQGTRCHQLALYMVLDSPLNMLCDSPTNYFREPECTEFIAGIPTVWDETIILDGKIGEYIITARRSGEKWYVGAIGNWDARDIEIDLSFLPEGPWSMRAFADGVNADKKAIDYKVTSSIVSNISKLNVHLARGGGWAAVIAAPQLTFKSSDRNLEETFDWAVKTALSYAHYGENPVGYWYESALPPRNAFCMRDVSHQSMGAEILGLSKQNYNMMQKFASNISESKDWCTYWEIDKDDKPCPADYVSDEDFWYNLNANFDVMFACWRIYEWTGDRRYIEDAVLNNFYARSAKEYVDRWQLNPDQLLTRPREMNDCHKAKKFGDARGVPSYVESYPDLYCAADLVATIYGGYDAYSRILAEAGDSRKSVQMAARTEEYRRHLDEKWWSDEINAYHTFWRSDKTFADGEGLTHVIWFNAVKEPARIEGSIEKLMERKDWNIENVSHFPLLWYRCNYRDEAYGILKNITSADRREYPEVSFGMIEGIISGTMGILPSASQNRVTTLPQITGDDCLQIENLPMMGGYVSVRHDSNCSSMLQNFTAGEITWEAAFTGDHDELLVNGKSVKAQKRTDAMGCTVSYAEIKLAKGGKACCKIK